MRTGVILSVLGAIVAIGVGADACLAQDPDDAAVVAGPDQGGDYQKLVMYGAILVVIVIVSAFAYVIVSGRSQRSMRNRYFRNMKHPDRPVYHCGPKVRVPGS